MSDLGHFVVLVTKFFVSQRFANLKLYFVRIPNLFFVKVIIKKIIKTLHKF